MYGIWDGKELLREVLDPAGIAASGISRTRNGQPVALVDRLNASGGTSFLLAQKTQQGWEFSETPLDGTTAQGGMASSPDGKLYFAGWQPDERRLVLLVLDSGVWRSAVLAGDLKSEPTWWRVLVDSEGRPVVVVGLKAEDGWVRVYRRNPQ